jgi:putative lipoprotein
MSALFLSQIIVASGLAFTAQPAAHPDRDAFTARPPVIRIAETGEKAGRSPLAGTEWMLTTLNGKDVDPAIGSSLGFDEEGGAHGHGGCNRFRGGVTVKGDTLKFGNLASTMMACEEAKSQQEFAFHEALGKTASFRIEAGDLVLLDGQGNVVSKLTASK